MLIYAAIGAFGLLFLLLMLFIGEVFGGDHDAGGADHDGGVDHGDADGGGPSLFSARIMAAFLTAFGVGGVLGRYYGLSHPASSGIGVASGIVLSGIVFQFAKLLYSQQASSEVRMAGLVGRTGEITVAIRPGGVGQVTLSYGGQRTEHVARAADSSPIPQGAEVIVKGLRGDSVVVERPAGVPSGGKG